MIIDAQNLGKKFVREWIIKDFNFTFQDQKVYAVRGPNGSGKSTLLKVLSGLIPPTKGQITYRNEGIELDDEKIHKHISICAPYQELVEELSLDEFLDFHNQFRAFRKGENRETFKEKTFLGEQGSKQIKFFSSGMKQRIRLGLCFYFESKVLMLDEGSSNLDAQGIEWFKKEVSAIDDRMVILFSNLEQEFELASEQVSLRI